jgi:hypothetical protein
MNDKLAVFDRIVALAGLQDDPVMMKANDLFFAESGEVADWCGRNVAVSDGNVLLESALPYLDAFNRIDHGTI